VASTGEGCTEGQQNQRDQETTAKQKVEAPWLVPTGGLLAWSIMNGLESRTNPSVPHFRDIEAKAVELRDKAKVYRTLGIRNMLYLVWM